MSSVHSPGPSNNPMFTQSASNTPSARQKNKAYTAGIAAGVEDEKYQAKYKELKRKVKEIELDNDKLRFKVLTAKKSIQRMKLERAVLYERLSTVPPSPDLHGHHALPPMHPGPGVPPQPSQPISASMQHRDHSRGIDVNDHNTPDYIHTSGNVRVISGPDSRLVQVSDSPIGPGVPPSMPAVHMSRRSSSSGQDSRQLPPLSQLTPVQSHLEHQRPPAHSQAQSPHLLPHNVNSDARSRSHSSSSRLRGPLPSPHGYHTGGISHPQQYPFESVPPGQQGQHSPPMGHERDRPRQHDSHERGNHDPHPHQRPHMTHPSPHSTLRSPVNTRGSSSARAHHHQRLGAGSNINHIEYENERQLDRERDRPWSRQREHDYDRETAAREYGNTHASPPPPSHSRSRLQDPPPSSSYRHSREEQYYASSREPIGPGMYGRTSRADTPESASASGNGNSASAGEGHSRLDYHAHYYDREQARPYAPRSINNPQVTSEETEYGHEDGRPAAPSRERDRIGSSMYQLLSEQRQPPQTHRLGIDMSRKRSRNDMDVDGEDDVGVDSPTGNNSSGGGCEAPSSRYNPASHRTGDRGSSKRLHQEGSSQAYGGHDEPEEDRSD